MKLVWDLSELTKFSNNLSDVSKFEREMRFAAKSLAATLLKRVKNFTPIGNTYELVNGWNGNDFAVRKVSGGFEVLLVNRDEKASWVNDGHRVRNRADGEYLIVHNRIKVPTARQWQKNASNMYVFGHFFVEQGILQLNNSRQVEQIITQKLQKWWNSV